MASNEALDLAKRGADAQLEMINSTRAVLEVVARAYVDAGAQRPGLHHLPRRLRDRRAVDPRRCRWSGPNDRIICSTRASAVGLDVSDRPYIQDARAQLGLRAQRLPDRAHHQPAGRHGGLSDARQGRERQRDHRGGGRPAMGRPALRPGRGARRRDRHCCSTATAPCSRNFPEQPSAAQNFADHPLFREVFSRVRRRRDGGGFRRRAAHLRLRAASPAPMRACWSASTRPRCCAASIARSASPICSSRCSASSPCWPPGSAASS